MGLHLGAKTSEKKYIAGGRAIQMSTPHFNSTTEKNKHSIGMLQNDSISRVDQKERDLQGGASHEFSHRFRNK